ncbi:hypothetical protein ACLB1E_26975 [Escherichia coli]
MLFSEDYASLGTFLSSLCNWFHPLCLITILLLVNRAESTGPFERATGAVIFNSKTWEIQQLFAQVLVTFR